jgi:Coenzyme PQQ synthesis protein D (PqqD)
MKNFSLLDHVSIAFFDDSAIILDSQKGIYYGLNDSGADFFILFNKIGSVELAVKEVSIKYEISLSLIENDLNNLITNLEEFNLIKILP